MEITLWSLGLYNIISGRAFPDKLDTLIHSFYCWSTVRDAGPALSWWQWSVTAKRVVLAQPEHLADCGVPTNYLGSLVALSVYSPHYAIFRIKFIEFELVSGADQDGGGGVSQG